ncbi:DUF5937 family protein [Actinoallomurus rhizosphaericola]|uniref:DUF5937 family protein n=1 Tax=Actinoallomurus rhizosphaericola TaxID=2952536 RepID=UPI003873252F
MEAYWHAALAPYWPRMRTLLEGDVLHRARILAEGGAQRLLDDLDPNVSWHSETLYVGLRYFSGTGRLRGRGLLLVPSVFVWPHLFAVTTPGWQPTLRYPPRAASPPCGSDAADRRLGHWPRCSAGRRRCCSANWTLPPPPPTWRTGSG